MIEEISHELFNLAQVGNTKRYWDQDQVRFVEYWEFHGKYYWIVYFGKHDAIEYYRTDDFEDLELLFNGEMSDIIKMQDRRKKLELL
jgi:hypothetical protein